MRRSVKARYSIVVAAAASALSAVFVFRDFVCVAASPATTANVRPGDWAQWGGSSIRNNTPAGHGIPSTWKTGVDPRNNEFNKSKAKNIKWVARLGSQSYGNAVIANGKVYAGTNNGAGHLKRYPVAVDLGCLLCFDEEDGRLLWQHSSEKLPTGRVHDWPQQGICCAPLVEGDRLWFVTSRGEVLCLDTEGFHDGEDDGPVKGEWARQFDLVRKDDPKEDRVGPAIESLNGGKLTEAAIQEFAKLGIKVAADAKIKVDDAGKKWSFTSKDGTTERQYQVRLEGTRLGYYRMTTPADKDEADVIWRLDMMRELGVSQHNMCSCSVTAAGDLLFVNTSNGVDDGHVNIPAPNAPSFLAINKNTGKVVWGDGSPGKNVLHGQWSSPAHAVIGGQAQVLFGGGDGWLYSFDPTGDGKGKAKLLWRFDANPKESKYALAGKVDRNHIIGTPVVYDNKVYVGVGEDPEHGEGIGHLWCIDPTKRGDISPELAFNVNDLEHPIPHRRLQAVIKEEGEVAKPNPNSGVIWHYANHDLDKNGKIAFEETMHRTCGTVAIKDDLLFVADFSGVFHCLNAQTGVPYWTHDMLAASWGSPLIVDDKVYIADEDGDIAVFAFSKDKELIAENNMGGQVYSTPVVANNVLYIGNQQLLFAIEADKK